MCVFTFMSETNLFSVGSRFKIKQLNFKTIIFIILVYYNEVKRRTASTLMYKMAKACSFVKQCN